MPSSFSTALLAGETGRLFDRGEVHLACPTGGHVRDRRVCVSELDRETVDVAIVGAGAAGLATAIFLARSRPDLRICCLDGARTLGAKILVSGGSRCNITNRDVSERDYWGGSRRTIARVLRAFPVARTEEFFRDVGVPLHEEADGKLFPDSHRARTVVEALLAEAAHRQIVVRTGSRVVDVGRADRFMLAVAGGRTITATVVVLTTGGRSLPRTGSDGYGYELAARFGHGCVPTTPALAPLILGGDAHAPLRGVTMPAALMLDVDGRRRVRLAGSLLWTHFGISGPAALDLSRHWLRATLEDRAARVTLGALPDDDFASLDRWLGLQQQERARSQVGTVLGARMPMAVVDVALVQAGIAHDVRLAHLPRDARKRLAGALTDWPLDVRDSRGYTYAEATAGGVPLDELDPHTLASRRCPGLFFAGEMLDVDGRLGGFNFQWAWSSAWVAAAGIARALRGCKSEG